MVASGFIAEYFPHIDTMIDKFAFDGYANISHGIAPALYVGIGLYISLTGVLMVRGSIELSEKSFTDMIWAIVVATTLALNWDFVSYYVYKLSNYFVLGAAQQLFDAVGNNYSGGVNSLYDFIQQIWTKQNNIGEHFFAQVTWKNWSPAFYGWAVKGISLLLIIMTLLEITILKMAFALLIVFMPMFAIFILIPKFAHTVDSYIQAMLGTVIALMFVFGAVAICFSLIDWSLQLSYGQFNSIPNEITNSSIWPFVIVSGVSIGFIGYAMRLGYSCANSAGGGSTGSAMISGVMAFAWAKMSGPGRALGKSAANRYSEYKKKKLERSK